MVGLEGQENRGGFCHKERLMDFRFKRFDCMYIIETSDDIEQRAKTAIV